MARYKRKDMTAENPGALTPDMIAWKSGREIAADKARKDDKEELIQLIKLLKKLLEDKEKCEANKNS